LVNKFTNRMKSTLEEAKAALAKSKDDMARYYNQKRTKAPEYQPGDKVYLDASDIQTNQPIQSGITLTKLKPPCQTHSRRDKTGPGRLQIN
jgi:Tfp pilus assembly protein PilE